MSHKNQEDLNLDSSQLGCKKKKKPMALMDKGLGQDST